MKNERISRMLKAFTAKEIAWIEQCHITTVMSNRKRYIPIRIDTTATKAKKRGFGMKYLRVCDLDKYMKKYRGN